jgi:hypothetical protein
MTLREAIGQYILWRQAHGAKFTAGANLLRHFLGYADGDAACDAVATAQVLAFLAGKGPLTRHRENKYYALAGFWRHAISRGHSPAAPFKRHSTPCGASLGSAVRQADQGSRASMISGTASQFTA